MTLQINLYSVSDSLYSLYIPSLVFANKTEQSTAKVRIADNSVLGYCQSTGDVFNKEILI